MSLKDRIEKLASFYEEEGLVREAYHLDILLNTLDQKAEDTPNTPQGIKGLSGHIEELLSMVKRIIGTVEDNAEKMYLNSDEEKVKMIDKFRKNHKDFLKYTGDDIISEKEARKILSNKNT